MNRTYSSQIIMPKIGAADRPRAVDAEAPTLDASSTTIRSDRAPARPGRRRSSARNTERRDQSICAERQIEDAQRRRERATADGGSGGSAHALHQILEDGLQVVVGRRDFVNRAESPDAASVGEPRVEGIRPRRLDDHRAVLEPQAEHVVVGEELARERARLIGFDVDRVRVLVDEIANLVDVAFGENPSLVDQQDVRRSSTRSRAGCGSRR